MFKILGIILIVVAAAITAVSWYAGIFDSVTLSYEEVQPQTIIYREHTGPYEGNRVIMNDVYRYVRDSLSLATDSGFSVFYDNPAKTAEENCRSLSGIIIHADSCTVRTPYVKAQTLKTEAVVGRFPLRSFFSYMTGSYKFYTRREQYARENKLIANGPVLELYDMKSRTIIYIAPCGAGVTPLPVFTGK